MNTTIDTKLRNMTQLTLQSEQYEVIYNYNLHLFIDYINNI